MSNMKDYYEKQVQKLFDDELSEVMTIEEFNSICNREMISADLWNRFTSFARHADESKYYYCVVIADVDYLEKLAKYQGNFELLELVLRITKQNCNSKVWGAEFYAPKIQASDNGKKNAGVTKAKWKELFKDAYERNKNDLPSAKGWMALLNIMIDDGHGEFDHSDSNQFIFESDKFDKSISLKTIQNEFSELKKK
ncbi:hypothetical protein AB4430_18530 [Vibrio kanaloae]|uniref:hypothetical protein n=1 Tax=Vibrio kanaloae TaxID=170673 RepID=UPI00355011C5